MLGEKCHGARDLICLYFWDEEMVASVVVEGWPNTPCISATTTPGTLRFGRFVNDHLASGRGKRKSVQIIWAMNGLVS
jgi:hypothetical protein